MNDFPKNFLVATSTKADGNMDRRFGEEVTVLTNRQSFLAKSQLEYDNLATMRSLHKDIVAVVAGEHTSAVHECEGETLEADALITTQPGLILGLTTADCMPIAFCDPESKTIGLIHLSRHTAALGLLQKTLDIVSQKLRVNIRSLLVTAGPHIKKESYCFPLPLEQEEPELASYIHKSDTQACIDLPAFASDVLTKAGVHKENIIFSAIDTATSPDHYSHLRATRSDEEQGRMITVVTWNED